MSESIGAAWIHASLAKICSHTDQGKGYVHSVLSKQSLPQLQAMVESAVTDNLHGIDQVFLSACVRVLIGDELIRRYRGILEGSIAPHDAVGPQRLILPTGGISHAIRETRGKLDRRSREGSVLKFLRQFVRDRNVGVVESVVALTNAELVMATDLFPSLSETRRRLRDPKYTFRDPHGELWFAAI